MKSIAFFFLTSFGMLMVSCAGTPEVNPIATGGSAMVQEAEQAYKQAKADTQIVNNAPVALEKAAAVLKSAKSAAKQGKDQSSVKQLSLLAKQRVQIAREKAELKVVRKQVQGQSRELQRLMQKVQQSEQKLIQSGQMEVEPAKRAQLLNNFRVRQTNRGLVLKFLNLNFDVGKAYLTSWAEQSVNELANFLNTYPKRTILIEGHTDNSGSKSLNKKLSQQRADFIREALISRGIADTRISAVGLGEQYPLVSNSTASGRRQNRRVIVILSDKNGEIKARK